MGDSELFGHVFKTHKSNPIIHVYELANIFNCRHSKNRLFEVVCKYFESPKLIQFRTPRQNVSSLPLVSRPHPDQEAYRFAGLVHSITVVARGAAARSRMHLGGADIF
jgi:hypothetical protein